MIVSKKFNFKSHNKAVFSVIGIIAFMSCIFAYNGYFIQYQAILNKAKQQNGLIDRIHANNHTNTDRFFEILSNHLKENQRVNFLLESKNYSELTKVLQSLISEDNFIKEYELRGIVYDLQNSQYFPINKKIENYNPDTDSIIKEAAESGKIISGHEIFNRDLYSIYTIPLFNQDKAVAVLKIGLNIRERCSKVSQSIKAASAIYIKNEHTSGLSPVNIKQRKDYTLICKDKSPFSELPYAYSFQSHNRLVKVGDKHFSIVPGPQLKNHDGISIGFIAIAYDSSDDVNNINQMHINYIIITIVMCTLAYFLLQFNFGKLLKTIEDANKSLSIQHFTDSLTGLPNRYKLFEDINVSVTPYLVIINIDRFKEINEVFGIEVGDYVLKSYADLLLKYMRELSKIHPEIARQYTVYRLGRDEFIILLDHQTRFNFAIADYITYKTDYELITANNIDISISATIGISNVKNRLIQCADIALKEARNRKLKFLQFHDSFDVIHDYANNIAWFNKIKKAISENKIVPYYQPIINNRTGKIEKYECLVRKIDDSGKAVPPGAFLSIIKKTRLYPELTKIVISKAIENFQDKDCDFSVNISMEDILNVDLVNFILEKAANMNNPKTLVFEIVETEGIENYEEVNSFISKVRHFGCKIAIDDFGTGYSSFEYLIKLGVDYLKIDGSLIKNMLDDKNAYHVVQTISTFAKKIGIKTIAEFIESYELQQAVKEIGIDYSQGYYFCAPSKETQDCDNANHKDQPEKI